MRGGVYCPRLLLLIPSFVHTAARLRPLWPALGIIGVALLVSMFMLGFFTMEKIIEKKKQHKYVEGASSKWLSM